MSRVPLGVTLLAIPQLFAAELTVTTTVDVVDPTDSLLSLREAILTANASPEDDTILLPAAIHELSLVGIDNTAALGDLDLFPNSTSGSLTIRGVGPDSIIDSSLIAPNRAFHALTGSIVRLGSLTIRGGTGVPGAGINSSGYVIMESVRFEDNSTETVPFSRVVREDPHSETDGGAVYLSRWATLVLDQCEFVHNEAGDNGGAIYNNNGTVIATHCLFDNNEVGDSGGAIRTEARSSSSIQDCVFSRNKTDGWGGAIASNGATDLSHCVFHQNVSAGSSGAILFDVSSNIVSLGHCHFSENIAAGDAGALRFIKYGNIFNSTFEGNISGGRGGAMVVQGTGTIRNCSFLANRSVLGGGALSCVGSVSALNSTFSNNETDLTTGLGGAILTQEGADTVFTNCTLHNNRAAEGGQFYLEAGFTVLRNVTATSDLGGSVVRITGGSLDLSNSILNSVDSSTSHSAISNEASGDEFIYPGGHNFLGDNTSVELLFPEGSPNAEGDFAGTSLSPLDPLLAPLAHYGGPTKTRPPLPGSPLIDAGDSVALPPDLADLDHDGDLTEPLPLDQRGFPRIADTAVDIGAAESMMLSFAILHPTLDPAADANQNGFPNHAEYSAGLNPSDPTATPNSSLLISEGAVTYTHPLRSGLALFSDLAVAYQYSTTLAPTGQPGGWTALPESAYSLNLSDPAKPALDLTPTFLSGKPALFLRYEFTSGD